jgi:hypothetical protein
MRRYDRGANPMKKEKNDGTLPVRQELGTIIYEHNVLGTRGPRKMTVVLPKAMAPPTDNEQINT